MAKYLWISVGALSVALGFVGIFVPLLPTTPFLLLAAFAFSKGSERLHTWLVEHPTLGPPIKDWQEHGAISRKAKILATVSMVAVLLISVLLGVPTWALLSQGAVLCCVAFFLWSRPERA